MDQLVQTLRLRLINRNRPVFLFRPGDSCKREIIAMYDSGASTPVWCKGEQQLRLLYPDIVRKNEVSEVTGFGSGSVPANVFVIPVFNLSSEGVVYCIRNLQIAESFNPRIGCDFILSDTMFSHTDTHIYRRGDRRIEIVFDKEEYQCTPVYTDGRFVVSTWIQE